MSFHVRLKEKEITDTAVLKKILKSSTYVTLALSMNDQPYLVPLSHDYDEDRNSLFFHCAKEGKKLDYLRSNNAVWGQALIDRGYAQGECSHKYASVHFSGKVVILESLEEKLAAVKCLIYKLDSNPEKLVASLNSERLKSTVIGRIDID